MNSTKLIATIIAVLVVVGLGAYALRSKQNDTMMQHDEMIKTEESTTTGMNDGAMQDKDERSLEGDMVTSGSYESYSPEKIARAATGKVVLFFRASWCPTCKAVDADIRANLESIPAGLTILDVNYDDSTELKQKYGVTYQHTFVQVDASGKQIAKWSGSPTLESLLDNVK